MKVTTTTPTPTPTTTPTTTTMKKQMFVDTPRYHRQSAHNFAPVVSKAVFAPTVCALFSFFVVLVCFNRCLR